MFLSSRWGSRLATEDFTFSHPHTFPANTKGEKAGAFKKGETGVGTGKYLFLLLLGRFWEGRRWRFERILSLRLLQLMLPSGRKESFWDRNLEMSVISPHF